MPAAVSNLAPATPTSNAEQLTFGPTEAEGLAVSPDGRSLVTSIGLVQDAVYINENGNNRQVSAEGDAILPAWGDGLPTSVFSPDGQKLYTWSAHRPGAAEALVAAAAGGPPRRRLA